MLRLHNKLTIDPALCLGTDSSGSGEILFVNDQCCRQDEWVTVGSIKLVDQQVLESSHVLTAFTGNSSNQQKQTSSSQSSHRAREEERARGPQLASGILSSGTKLVAYSTEGHLTCFDKQLSRRIPCDAATLVLTTKRRKPVKIRCAAAARTSDDLFFFSLVGSRSVYVLHFVDSREEGGIVARMISPIRIESTALEHDGIAVLECHPSLPYVVIAGIEGPAEVYSYAPLLQRIRAQSSVVGSDGRHPHHANFEGHGEGHEDQDNSDDDDREPDTNSRPPPRPRQSSVGSATNATKSTGTTAALRKGIFSLFGQQVEVNPDFLLIAMISAPAPLSLQPSSFGSTVAPPMTKVHKLAMHPSGSLMAVVFEYHTRLDHPVPPDVPTVNASPSKNAVPKSHIETAQSRRATLQSSCVCVYDITASALPSSAPSSSSGQEKTRRGTATVPPTLEAMAKNYVRYCESDLGSHQTSNGSARREQAQAPGAVRQERNCLRAHRAVFAVCFYPFEPLLLLGLAARYIGRQTGNVGGSDNEEGEDNNDMDGGEKSDRQEVTICALTLLEPSLRLLDAQVVPVPDATSAIPSPSSSSSSSSSAAAVTAKRPTETLISTVADSHAVGLLCCSRSGLVVVKFWHSETRTTRVTLPPPSSSSSSSSSAVTNNPSSLRSDLGQGTTQSQPPQQHQQQGLPLSTPREQSMIQHQPLQTQVRRVILRPCTTLICALGEDWRRAHGCTASRPVTSYATPLPLAMFELDQQQQQQQHQQQHQKQQDTQSSRPSHFSSSDPNDFFMLMVRPVGHLPGTTTAITTTSRESVPPAPTTIAAAAAAATPRTSFVSPQTAPRPPLRFDFPVFQVAVTQTRP